jgi:hypothetical protein
MVVEFVEELALGFHCNLLVVDQCVRDIISGHPIKQELIMSIIFFFIFNDRTNEIPKRITH